MEELIRDGILNRKVLTVHYKGLVRVVEAYLLFETKDGAIVVHAWQVSGEYEKTPPPDWCNMGLLDISLVVPTGDIYHRPRDGYNPQGSGFHKVLVFTPAH